MTNCYNTGKVSAAQLTTLTGISAYVGGMVGRASGTPSITNCYFLTGTLTKNGVQVPPEEERLCGRNAATVDGNTDGTPRDGIQGSGAKSPEDMRSTATPENSVYYTGETTVGTETVPGWDLGKTWTFADGINEGYPILSSFLNITVSITGPPQDVYIKVGDVAVFSSHATATRMLPQYQWEKSRDKGATWTTIPGSFGMNDPFGPTVLSDKWTRFRVIATAPGYNGTTVISDPATLYFIILYNVVLTTGPGYKMTATDTSKSPVQEGGSFSFTLDILEGYGGTPIVKANDTELEEYGGVYVIGDIMELIVVTVEGVTLNRYAVELPSGTGYTLTPQRGSSSPVNHGGSFSFWFEIDEGYGGTPIVKANGVKLTPQGILYTISGIRSDQTVTVEGVTINTYTVEPLSGTGYALTAEGTSSSPVDHGGSFSFTLEIAEGYGGTPIVKANGTVLDDNGVGVYVISDITEDQTITVDGLLQNIYAVGPTSGHGYELTAEPGNDFENVPHGDPFSFKLSLDPTYPVPASIVVKANGVTLTAGAGDVYKIPNVTSNQLITVDGILDRHEVFLPSDPGYIIKEVGRSVILVNHGGSFSFTLRIAEGYGGTPIVQANGVTLTLAGGVYTISNITEDTNVTVEGISLNRYDVVLSSGQGYTLTPQPDSFSPVKHGGSFSFTLAIADGAEGTPIVKANGITLTATGGVYTISGITSDQTVTVEGLTMKTYTIGPLSGIGYTLIEVRRPFAIVEHNASFSFALTRIEGYGGTPTVKANGVVLKEYGGVYVMSGIKEDQIITVDGLSLNIYTVTVLGAGEGSFEYSINGGDFIPLTGVTIKVGHGSSLQIRAIPGEGHVFIWDDMTGVSGGIKTITGVSSGMTVSGEFTVEPVNDRCLMWAVILITPICVCIILLLILLWHRNKEKEVEE
jgi:hypothetical protein